MMLAAIADNPLLPAVPLFVAVALGMAALYFLLPRPRPWPFARIAGAAAGGLALAGAAVVAARTARLSAETFLFYAFSGLAFLSGGVMITRANPARAALSFAIVVLSTTGLFLLQAAPFLMAGSVIVYAGAIIVTFLFVIMLAQQDGVSDADQRSREPLLATIAGFFLLATLLLVLRQTYTTGEIDALLAKVNAARQRDSLADIRSALGDQVDFVARLERQADRVPAGTAAGETLRQETDGAGAAWSAPSADLARKRLDSLAAALVDARAQIGRLQPSPRMPLSPFAGTPANQKPAGLPAENVAGLGRTLFSDYLLAVEIAGTLLLVAAIGAIVIAQRPVSTGRAP
ncbi:MAG TPA: NADH-quinone oxidoreductase subunit J [Gemmataceae bacterium]|nr:NADH-quinone oxidoreductase subunit J [Gemmataceae bacterium]